MRFVSLAATALILPVATPQRRLYILEATVPKGATPPLEFQMSLSIVGEDGKRVRFDVDAKAA